MNKIFFSIPKPESIKFQNGNLPAEIDLPFLAYSDKWNTNTQNSKFNYIYDIKDLIEPEKTRFIEEHTDDSNEPSKGQLIKNTFLYDKKIEKKTDKDGEYEVITARLYSNNPKFIKNLKEDKYKGFSVEIAPLNNDSVFFNDSNQIYFKQATMPYIATLSEEPPAVGSAGVIGKLNFSKKANFGYEDIPKKVFFKNNNNNMDEKQIAELVAKATAEAVEAKFTAFEKKQEEAKQVKFSISKETTPEEAFKSLQAKFSSLNDYELVKKTEDEDGEGEDDQTETVKFSKIKEALKNNGKVGKVSKEGDHKPKPKAITFQTFNN